MRKLAGLLLLLASGAACAGPGAHGGQRSAAQDAALAFWTSGYSGADLAGGNLGCAAPELPAVPHANRQVRSVRQAIVKWEQCHDRFMARLAAMPLEARIPAGVLASMTPAERARARQHMRGVLVRVAASAQANAAAMMARHATWLGATVEHVAQPETGRKRAD